MIVLGIILFVSSIVFSYALNVLLYKYARGIGGRGKGQDVVRWGSTSKPTLGGIAFFAVFLSAALVYYATQLMPSEHLVQYFGMVAAVTLGFFIGLQDDAYNTRPLLKLMGQITCGVVLIMFDTSIDLFGIPALDYALTIFWVVGIMNSINLLDNMDGVTGTVSLVICAVSVVLISLFPGDASVNPFLFILVAMSGGLLGFLKLNWKPSSIYMGDTGSQFLGVLLAIVGIRFFWNIHLFAPGVDGSMQIIAPLMVFMVPVMDTTFVFINRISKGNSPFVGGKDHTTHHLTYLGVPEHVVPLLMGLISAISGVLAIFSIRYVAFWSVYHTIVFAAYLVISFGIFFFLFKRGEKYGYIKQRFARTLNRIDAEKRGQLQAKTRSKAKQHS